MTGEEGLWSVPVAERGCYELEKGWTKRSYMVVCQVSEQQRKKRKPFDFFCW